MTEKQKLDFAYAEITRLIRQNLDDDKIIKEQVKIEICIKIYIKIQIIQIQ